MKSGLFALSGGLLAAAGLVLPGLGWARLAQWPAPWLAAFLLSVLVQFSGVVGCSALGVPVTVWSLGLWSGIVALAGWLIWKKNDRSQPVPPSRSFDGWTLVALLPFLAVATWRAVLQPLPGADVDFRWNYLAELIVADRGLMHYPPVGAEGFAHYFWADGIAPLVSSVYAWTYLAVGTTDRAWTALPVLMQIAGLLLLVRELGALWGGTRGANWAGVLAAATMLLQFAFNLGQETGFTALGAGSMTLFLVSWERDRRTGLLAAAAIGAAVAACAREYGAAFALAGTLWVAWRGGARNAAAFFAAALFLPLAWHLRNFVLTGNPFYAHHLPGVPINPVFHDWMQMYAGIYGAPLKTVAGWRECARLLALTALPASAGLIAGLVLWRGRPGWAGTVAVTLAGIACWIASVPFTAGGFFYSMRVLSPVLVLGCAWGGAALASWSKVETYKIGLGLAALLFACDASLRAWTIPVNPYEISPREWPDAGYRLQNDFARENLPFLEQAAKAVSGKTLSESAGAQRVFRAAGRELVPFWSPEVAFAFQPHDRTGDVVARLQALGYSHLLLTRTPSTVDFLNASGAMAAFNGRLQLVMHNDTFILFAFESPSTTGAR
jgi:hypothetical protein